METSGAPKASLEQETQSVKSKELEQKASELASATKQNGMVNLFLGQRLSRKSPPAVASFIQGEGVEFSSRRGDISIFSDGDGALFDMLPPHGMRSYDPYGYQTLCRVEEHRQVWKIARYVPPMKKEFVDQVEEIKSKRFGFIPKTDKVTRKVLQVTNEPLSYNGKRGNPDWTQYDYYMRRYDKGENRHGGNLSVLSIAVPPNIAAQIDEEVAKNIYFPDAFFQALYPGYVGLNIDQNMKRFQATELQVVDCRTKPEKSDVLKYPQPLPY